MKRSEPHDTLRRMKHVLLALLVCFPVIAIAQSQNVGDSGNDFLRLCETSVRSEALPPDKELVGALQCMAWMHGALDGFIAYNTASATRLFNIPTDVTVRQFSKIVVMYMNDHPKDLNQTTAWLALLAIMDAYPAKK